MMTEKERQARYKDPKYVGYVDKYPHIDDFIPKAKRMADGKCTDRSDILWTHAFLAAMNKLTFEIGVRYLTPSDIKEVTKFYG